MEDKSLDELTAQYKQLEKSSNPNSFNKIVDSDVKNNLFKNYGIYLIFFVWVLIIIISLQPSYLYKKNEETNKYNFLWKRFFITLIIIYSSFVIIYLLLKYYLNKDY